MPPKQFHLFLFIMIVTIVGGLLIFKKNAKPAEPTVQAEQVQGLAMDVASYANYSEALLSTAMLKGKVVLFFAATGWCQTCSALDDEIVERQAEIPSDVTILKVDYDNDKVMDDSYHVVRQHTLIVLDSDGKELTRWVGGDFDQLLDELSEI